MFKNENYPQLECRRVDETKENHVTHVSCHPDCISLNHNTVSRPTNV